MKSVTSISFAELSKMASRSRNGFVKVVVDVAQNVMVVDPAWHVEAQQWLLDHGSQRHDLWGARLHPELFETERFIEYNAATNIQPEQHNFERTITDADVRAKVRSAIMGMIRTNA